MQRYLGSCSLLALAIASSLPCAARAQVVQSPAIQSPAAKPANAAPPKGGHLEEIVVTAQRRSENLQKAAVNVTALSGASLVRANVTQATDLTKLVSGLAIAPTGPVTQVFIRGVGSYAVNPYAEQAVAFNLDGVYIAPSVALGGVFYDLSRVEVLKGPQGTLYGRNATAGAINVLTNKPNFDGFSADLSVEAGDYALTKVEGAVNATISPTLAVRGAFQTVSREGYYTDGTDDDKQQSGRVEALWKPSSDLSVLVEGDLYHLGGDGGGSTINPFLNSDPFKVPGSSAAVNGAIFGLAHEIYGPFLGSLIERIGLDPHQDTISKGVHAEINYNLGFANLTILPSFRYVDASYFTYAGGFQIQDPRETYHETTVEARLSSVGDGPLKWVGGFYFFKQNEAFDPSYNQGLLDTNLRIGTSDDAYAGFGQATYSITSRLRLTGGLRYTAEGKSEQGEVVSSGCFSGGPPCGPFNPPHAPVAGDVWFHAVNYHAGVEYDLTPHSLLYFSAADAFKAGGLNAGLAPNTFQPETLTDYSIGSKNRFLDNRLQINAEGFYWDYANHQESHLGPVNLGLNPQTGQEIVGVNQIQTNVGKETLYGVDLDTRYAVTDNDTLSVKFLYEHSRATSFEYQDYSASGAPPVTGCAYGVGSVTVTATVFNVNCSGKPVVRAPKYSANLELQHIFALPNDAQLIADVRSELASGTYVAVDYLATDRQEGFTRTDFDLTYRPPSGGWSLTGYVDNIEDSKVINNAYEHPFVPLTFVFLRPPRTYGFRASVHF